MKNKLKKLHKLEKFCVKKGINFTLTDGKTIRVSEADIPEKYKAEFEFIFNSPLKENKSKKDELAPKLEWMPMFTYGVPRIWHSHKPGILNKISQPESLTKEALRDLTEPKRRYEGFASYPFKIHDEAGVYPFGNKDMYSQLLESVVPKKISEKEFVAEVNNMAKLYNVKLLEELVNLKPKEKLYTQDQMLDCFNESRLTNPITGFKFDSFAAYLDSLEK